MMERAQHDLIIIMIIIGKQSSHFETDYENRLGFGKYIDGMADTMWDHAVSLIKYAGKRGAGLAPIESTSGLKLTNVIIELICFVQNE